MKQEYKSSIRSKKMIRQAVVTLLQKKNDINRITVTDVVNEADINRGTFYNHYNNINDVINEIEDELMGQLSSVLEENTKADHSVENIMHTLRDYFVANEEFYKTITPCIPQYVLDDMKKRMHKEFQKFYAEDNSNDSVANLLLLSNGLSGCLIDYFNNRLSMTLPELTESLIKAIYNYIR